MQIEKLTLNTIKYVNSVPDESEGQQRISWIKDGEPLNGASTRFGDNGELNRVGLQTHENILILENNDKKTEAKINEIVVEFDKISEDINEVIETGVIESINKNTADILILKQDTATANNSIEDINSSIESIRLNLGDRNQNTDTKDWTVRRNIEFLKTEIGSYPGFDISGDEDSDSLGSGMKYRIITLTEGLNSQNTRLTNLEEEFNSSGGSDTGTEVVALRTEIGDSSLAGSSNIYSRLNSLENKATSSETLLDHISVAIDLDNQKTISTRVGEVETLSTSSAQRVSQLEISVSSVVEKIGSPEIQNSIMGDIEIIAATTDDIQLTLNKPTTGIIPRVEVLEAEVGNKDSPATGTLFSKVGIIETQSNRNDTRITELTTTVGDSNSGLQAKVLNLTKVVEDGTNPSGSTVSEKGVIPSINENNSKIAILQTDVEELSIKVGTYDASVGKIPKMGTDITDNKNKIAQVEAEVDTQALEVAKIAGIDTRLIAAEASLGTAKSDITAMKPEVAKITNIEANITTLKADVAQLKIDVASRITEAPQDGKAYVRQDGSWVLLETFLTP